FQKGMRAGLDIFRISQFIPLSFSCHILTYFRLCNGVERLHKYRLLHCCDNSCNLNSCNQPSFPYWVHPSAC
ncbi:hypothetical protein COCVIDRAFT_92782, partial [Bipolaris victoriae FI3]